MIYHNGKGFNIIAHMFLVILTQMNQTHNRSITLGALDLHQCP